MSLRRCVVRGDNDNDARNDARNQGRNDPKNNVRNHARNDAQISLDKGINEDDCEHKIVDMLTFYL
jgi:hypothetical protein